MWGRVANIFGIRAVVGHTAVTFLGDDRLMYPLSEVDDSVLSCIAHNTVYSNPKSILLNGLAPGGDGILKRCIHNFPPAIAMMLACRKAAALADLTW